MAPVIPPGFEGTWPYLKNTVLCMTSSAPWQLSAAQDVLWGTVGHIRPRQC